MAARFRTMARPRTGSDVKTASSLENSYMPKFQTLADERRGCEMSTKRVKKVLVTGATGQIGSELTLELRKRYGGDNVVAVGHTKKPSDNLLKSGPFEIVDLNEKADIEKAV
jgi:NADPH:quinone reductase-like Zn-dependent oxidoreductase